MPKILFVFTGGTISMKIDPARGGAVPALSGRGILALAPGIEDLAECEVLDFARLAGWQVTPEHMFRLSQTLARSLEEESLAGAVVTHGTDTLEETAFLVDLRWQSEKPVVFAGAMRNSSETGFDGPRNLLAAARVAANREARNKGVFVVLNDMVHAASEATKSDTRAPETYSSPVFGPLALVEPDRILWRRALDQRFTLPGHPLESRVDLVAAPAGSDGRFVDCAAQSGARGIVIAATGRGNVPPPMLPAVQRAIDAGVAVVIASRCHHGRILDTYADQGSGGDLRKRGAIFAGMLPPHKARIKLMVILGATSDPAEIRGLMEQGLYG